MSNVNSFELLFTSLSYVGFLATFGDDERLRALRQKAEGF